MNIIAGTYGVTITTGYGGDGMAIIIIIGVVALCSISLLIKYIKNEQK